MADSLSKKLLEVPHLLNKPNTALYSLGEMPEAFQRTNRFDAPLKVAILAGLPALFGLWLGLSIAGSVLVGVGYGFFTPWVSAFEAFREDNESKKFIHCIVDGTWGTIKGSCTVVRDFADICYHSYPLYLEELRESPASNELRALRLIHVPACIIAGLMGLMVDIPLYTAIAIVKSPYMLFKGWFRLIHDLISREGPFLETACIPIAGLTILLWPIFVVASILIAIFSSIFIGLYASVIVYQERSFWRGLAYVIAMVAEFDEYTNDWLYLREGTVLPKPLYRKKSVAQSSEFSFRGNHVAVRKINSVSTEAPAMLMPSLANSRSVIETIQEVKVVQSISSKVMDALDNRPVSIRLKGLDCMKGSLAKARVLYAPVEEIGSEDRLLRACQVITDAYVEAGLVLEKDANQKLKASPREEGQESV
ncbi:putative membrane protein At3g27390 [Castanea sativa]|uniref:putative membrane protein At3g27390 n=1 Tax=Castanea sativa TaxID=21020 RepID=UPI003F64EAF8